MRKTVHDGSVTEDIYPTNHSFNNIEHVPHSRYCGRHWNTTESEYLCLRTLLATHLLHIFVLSLPFLLFLALPRLSVISTIASI